MGLFSLSPIDRQRCSFYYLSLNFHSFKWSILSHSPTVTPLSSFCRSVSAIQLIPTFIFTKWYCYHCRFLFSLNVIVHPFNWSTLHSVHSCPPSCRLASCHFRLTHSTRPKYRQFVPIAPPPLYATLILIINLLLLLDFCLFNYSLPFLLSISWLCSLQLYSFKAFRSPKS